jgi:gamma-glutamylcyclotransferase (GGCT)/AIG2-like uncharacterized protein YtfP
MMIFGYGTFITLRLFENKRNIRPAFLPKYYRIFRLFDSYPYILNASDYPSKLKPGFWGLTFDVNESELKGLDHYEGEGVLYNRIEAKCIFSDKSEHDINVYYPTESTIGQNQLPKYIHQGDTWLKKMKKENSDIFLEFPDLARSEDPRE